MTNDRDPYEKKGSLVSVPCSPADLNQLAQTSEFIPMTVLINDSEFR